MGGVAMKKKNKGIIEVFELDIRDYARIELLNDDVLWVMYNDINLKFNYLSKDRQEELEKLYNEP